MRGNRKHWSIAAMSVEEAIDQVEVAGAAATGAGRELPAQLSLGASGKSGGFFVAHMNKLKFVVHAQSIGHGIQTVAHDTVKPFYARLDKFVH
jgi:hypothetical protein